MEDGNHLRIWPGERQLLPSAPENHDLLVQCMHGRAYLRVMSDIQRHLLEAGDQHRVANGEVATLSGIEKTLVKIQFLKQKETLSDC